MTRTWRVTTALRAFVLAAVVGQTLTAGRLADVGVLVLALLAVASAAATLDIRVDRLAVPWPPVAEAVVVGVLVAAAGNDSQTLLLCLAVPAVVAGVRHGWITTVNAGLAAGLAFAAEAVRQSGDTVVLLGAAVPWVLIGLAFGLLAAHLTRSMRSLAEAQAPLATAHRLVTRLSALLTEGSVALDAVAVASDLLDDLAGVTGAHAGLLELGTCHADWKSFGGYGQQAGVASLELPLRVADRQFGRVLLWGSGRDMHSVAQSLLDERGIALETALMVDRVRAAATDEERRRLARDLHDGAAQRVVALGWMIDELAVTRGDRDTTALLIDLRSEVDLLVDDLRLSLFDLHQDVAGGLAAALTDYARELSARSDLRVHLTLDEQSPDLPVTTQAELLRITQEAIGNVHRHAGAINVWVSLSVHGEGVRLAVEDDGIGGALPRPGHYGLAGMSERAARIGANLQVGPRPDGGTRVELRSGSHLILPTTLHTEGIQHELRPAGR